MDRKNIECSKCVFNNEGEDTKHKKIKHLKKKG